MKLYKDTNGTVYAFEDDGSQDGLITESMTQLTTDEEQNYNKPEYIWDGSTWILDANLFIVTKKETLAAYRYEREIEGITINGAQIRTDRETQAVLLGARTKAKEDSNYTTMWKAVNGFVELTAPEIIAVADAVHDHVQKCFNAESVVDLEQCETEQDIKDAFDAAYNA